MSSLSSNSIKRQLQLFFVLILGLTVFMMGAVWVSYNRTLLEGDEWVLAAEADLIGAATRPALMFNDKRLAGELLTSLQIDSDISTIRIFGTDGKIFVSFPQDGENQYVPYRQHGSTFLNGKLQLYRTILHKGLPVGVVYIESKLTHLRESERTGMMTIAWVMLGSLILGLVIAMRLQKKITRPISELTEMMRRLGSEQDYSLRADESTGSRETAELASGFNQMAEKIQASFRVIRKHQAEMAESEKRFRYIAERAPMPVSISRLHDGRFLFFNRAAASLFGVTDLKSAPKQTLDFYQQPEDREKILQHIFEAGECSDELQIKRPDGGLVWISLSMSRIRFEQEDALFASFWDINEQKNIEQTLERINQQLEQRVLDRTSELGQAKEQLQSILDNMLDTYYRINADGTVNWASKSVEVLLGYNTKEIEGFQLHRLFADSNDFPKVVKDLIRHDGILMNYEVHLRHKHGHTVWVSISSHFITGSAGEVVGAEGVLRNISALKLAELEKQEMEKKVAHVQRLESLGVLAGGIAHDFNNLLTSIIGNAELAEIRAENHEAVADELAGIVSCSMRAADLCQQMLAYSGQGVAPRKLVNLSTLIEETVQLMEVSISKNVTLSFDLAKPLPAIHADETQMQQVIMNLLTNASEAIGNRPGRVSILTGSIDATANDLASEFLDAKLAEGRYVFLQVTDSGCGMDEATRQKIFDPFFSTKFTGRGLGMSAMLGIVRSHHGTIQVESETGQGTMVRILFPRNTEPVNTGKNESPDMQSINPKVASHVLVIDDEATVRSTVITMLKKMGCSTLEARDGLDGISIFRDFHNDIDLVLLDMTMPDMDGRQTLAKLREIDDQTPVLICSGYGYVNISEQFEATPPAGFLQKPYTMKTLKKTVCRFSKNSIGGN